MANLAVNYLGIPLKNPIIAGASNLVNNPETLKHLEEAGASAIVYKSLFEEQIQLESIQFQDELELYNERNAEMITLFPEMEHAGPEEHLTRLREARSLLNIPLIASLNCIFAETWVEYAGLLADTGVDALELNFFAVPRNGSTMAQSIEDEQVRVVEAVVQKVSIPVSVKLSPFYTNPLQVIDRMAAAGAKGFVLFNRLFEPDINLESLKHATPFNLSTVGDYKLSLRYAGMLFNKINADVCASTGIYSGNDIAKLLLAGAGAIQTVSALYKHKPSIIGSMLNELETFMQMHNYESIADFRGLLSRDKVKDPYIYKRAQYIDLLLHSEKIFNKYPLI
ncbi:MAG: dihydroorotate dehydrogenase-like protein [Lentimicrobium sp.]|jgi:dihydroorotate dehydrogenase (fumarate)|nr:dihydroorotate dehydrogenase-like protein [Lentimicrobium sp.]MDD2526443.1 dihydroorotate dehydrogenase-like protein [Lentimicrobiaceae bacterium]MDY0027159.1 dihydroorotate dehydrogenase-like protein [Lentimicrobium sp.]HAH60155.1 dihydroorotate dehydrogenase [Bacteroidales bacterium]